MFVLKQSEQQDTASGNEAPPCLKLWSTAISTPIISLFLGERFPDLTN
ncbi:MAG TPA: hypothetical protein VFD91_14440 [Mariniphaga sp.]|nr:hypothetical protein [Mariniphaga sp.]